MPKYICGLFFCFFVVVMSGCVKDSSVKKISLDRVVSENKLVALVGLNEAGQLIPLDKNANLIQSCNEAKRCPSFSEFAKDKYPEKPVKVINKVNMTTYKVNPLCFEFQSGNWPPQIYCYEISGGVWKQVHP